MWVIESLSEQWSGPPTTPSSARVPTWVGSYRLKLFAEHSQPVSQGLPVRIGQCTVTKITSVTANAEYDPDIGMPRGYAAVSYDNQGEQVNGYFYNEAIAESRVGDEVLLCLVSLPKNCPPATTEARFTQGRILGQGAFGCSQTVSIVAGVPEGNATAA